MLVPEEHGHNNLPKSSIVNYLRHLFSKALAYFT